MSDLLHLRTFLEIYRAGSLTRAAERLGITQPAASGHLATLEATLGKPLFLRQARGVRPTAAADDLAQAIAASLDHIEATMGAARARSDKITGTVHLIGPAEYLASRLTPLLKPLVAEGLRFRIQTGNRERIYAGLDGGHADLAVTASRPDGQRHGFTALETERQMLVAAPDLAARTKGRSVTAEFLATLPCLAYDETLPLIRAYCGHVFGRHPEIQAAATAPDLRILLGMAEAGTGWTVLPDYLCADALAAGTLVNLLPTSAGPDNTLYLVWNKAALRHPRVVHVRDRLLQAFGRTPSGPPSHAVR